MTLLLTGLVAVVLGAGWVVLLRRRPRRGRLAGAPPEVERALSAYRRGRWDEVVATAPGLLARPDGDDTRWRPALELALGHSLSELDRFDEAIPHLDRGLLLQAALRNAGGAGTAPLAGEAKLRHVLGYAYAATGRTSAARREYRRVLEIPDLDPEVRARVQASLDAL